MIIHLSVYQPYPEYGRYPNTESNRNWNLFSREYLRESNVINRKKKQKYLHGCDINRVINTVHSTTKRYTQTNKAMLFFGAKKAYTTSLSPYLQVNGKLMPICR